MFRRIEDTGDGPRVVIEVDGAHVPARQGEPVAIALLAHGITAFRRTSISSEPRGPLCLMGVCFECVVEVEGARVQSCITPVRSGMKVRLPSGPGTLEVASDA